MRRDSGIFEAELKKRKEVLGYLHSRGVKDETIQSWRLGMPQPAGKGFQKHLLSKGFAKDYIAEAGVGIKSEKKVGEVYDRFAGHPCSLYTTRPAVSSPSPADFLRKLKAHVKRVSRPKYVNSPETALFRKSRILYGYDRAKNFIRKARLHSPRRGPV